MILKFSDVKSEPWSLIKQILVRIANNEELIRYFLKELSDLVQNCFSTLTLTFKEHGKIHLKMSSTKL